MKINLANRAATSTGALAAATPYPFGGSSGNLKLQQTQRRQNIHRRLIMFTGKILIAYNQLLQFAPVRPAASGNWYLATGIWHLATGIC